MPSQRLNSLTETKTPLLPMGRRGAAESDVSGSGMGSRASGLKAQRRNPAPRFGHGKGREMSVRGSRILQPWSPETSHVLIRTPHTMTMFCVSTLLRIALPEGGGPDPATRWEKLPRAHAAPALTSPAGGCIGVGDVNVVIALGHQHGSAPVGYPPSTCRLSTR